MMPTLHTTAEAMQPLKAKDLLPHMNCIHTTYATILVWILGSKSTVVILNFNFLILILILINFIILNHIIIYFILIYHFSIVELINFFFKILLFLFNFTLFNKLS